MKTLAISFLVVATIAGARVHAASNVVQYTHDAAGNIVAIQRANTAPVAITGFSPTAGPVGTVVTISGSGFGATAAGNVLTFNGVPGSAMTAAPTALTVPVPAGATTGRISVTVAGSTATSAQDFVVTAPGAPTITGFTPTAGGLGTVVTVTGTNFNAAPGATTVRLNQSSATASSVTPTQLAFAVPAATGSGRIRIATGAGSAVSDADFVVPPAAVAAGNIIATTRLAANGPERNLSLLAAGKYGAILFDGNAGDWLSVQLRNFTVNPAAATIAYTIYKPDNTQLASGNVSAANLSVHLPALPASGTYTMLLGTGTAQVALDARLENDDFIPADGTRLAVARSAGQSRRALIAAVAGDQTALMVAGLTTVPAGERIDYTIYQPSGAYFRAAVAGGLGTTAQLPSFTVTGTHAVVFKSSVATTQASFKVSLLAGVALPIDGEASVAIANPGEGARLRFAGVAGQNLGIGITGFTLNPASAVWAIFTVYNPNATVLTSFNCYVDGTQCSVNLSNLPVTGNYSIIVQPLGGATGSLAAWLSRDVTGALVRGTPFGLTLSRPGQNVRLTFSGTAGAQIALQVRGIVTSPPAQRIIVQIIRPDGLLLASTYVSGPGQTMVAPPLPVAGTYVVFLEPEPGAKGAATATMEVLLDPGATALVAR